MEYSRNVIENGEAVIITFESAIMEFRDGHLSFTADGQPERMYVFGGDCKRFYEGMKQYYESRREKAEDNRAETTGSEAD